MTKYLSIALFLVAMVIAVSKGAQLFKDAFEGTAELKSAQRYAAKAHITAGRLAVGLAALLVIRLVYALLTHG